MSNESLKTIVDGLRLHVQNELKNFVQTMRRDTDNLGTALSISFRREAVARTVGYLDAACASGNLLTRHRDRLVEEVRRPYGHQQIAACFEPVQAPITEGEQSLYRWQYKLCGGFEKSFWSMMMAADSTNLALIGKGFPEHAEAFRRYANESGYWDALVKRIQATEQK